MVVCLIISLPQTAHFMQSAPFHDARMKSIIETPTTPCVGNDHISPESAEPSTVAWIAGFPDKTGGIRAKMPHVHARIKQPSKAYTKPYAQSLIADYSDACSILVLLGSAWDMIDTKMGADPG